MCGEKIIGHWHQAIFFFLLFFLALQGPVISQTPSPKDTAAFKARDTIFFKNGTVVIGRLKIIKLGVVSFDPDDANDITVQLRKLRAITASRWIFRIETTDHNLHFAKVMPDTAASYVKLFSIFDTLVVHLENISVLYPYRKSFIHRFDGSLGIGYSYTRSNNLGRLNYDSEVRYTTKNGELSLYVSGIYNMTDTSFSRDREDIFQKNNYFFHPTWFATVMFGYQRNLELSLLRRFQEALGMGNKFLTTKHLYAWGRGGLALNQEKSTEGEWSGTLAEIFGQLEVNFFRFVKPDINFTLAQTIYYGLTESGRFRNDGEFTMKWKVFRDFYFNLTFYNSFDSRPPVEGSPKFDLGTVIGINYTF